MSEGKQAPHQAAAEAEAKERPSDVTEETQAATEAQEEAELVILQQALEKIKKATSLSTKTLALVTRFFNRENRGDKEGKTTLLHRIVRMMGRGAKYYASAARDHAEANEPDEARKLQATAKVQRAEAEKFLIDGEIRIKSW